MSKTFKTTKSVFLAHIINLYNLLSLLTLPIVNFGGFAIAVTTADFSVSFFIFHFFPLTIRDSRAHIKITIFDYKKH